MAKLKDSIKPTYQQLNFESGLMQIIQRLHQQIDEIYYNYLRHVSGLVVSGSQYGALRE